MSCRIKTTTQKKHQQTTTKTNQPSKIMKKNVNKPDQFIRAALGIFSLFAACTNLFEDNLIQNASAIIGIYLLFTAVFRFCALYSFLGIHTEDPNKKMKMY